MKDKLINKEQLSERILWIDMAKGYGILFVIYAHVGGGWDRIWIYTFHMPLFFFLSGYVFSVNCNFKQFIIKKCKSIVIPYFCLGIPMILFEFIRMIPEQFTLSVAIHLIKHFVFQQRMWTLWFIACLFCLNILFYILVNVIKRDLFLVIVSIIMTVIGLCYYRGGGKPLLWNADVCFMAIPFFTMGYVYKKYVVRIDSLLDKKEINIVLFNLCAVLNLIFGFKSLDTSLVGLEMYDSKYGNPFYTYMAAFAGIVCVVIVAKWFAIECIRYIGENSMLYYAWHQTIFIPIVAHVLKSLGIEQIISYGTMGNVIYKVVMTFVIVILITVCNWFIIKNGWGVLLGKKS